MIKSADRKPEKYVGPDGKPKIRMVPVDKEVVKSEGGMKRIATTQSNKADRMAAGDKKGLETFKKKTDEACWDSHKQVGMKKKGNKMVPDCVPKNEAYSMKEMVCKSCGDAYGKPTNEACMYDAYDMAGENWCSRKEYMTAQKKKESVDEVLDTPGAMDRYHNKAKAQSDRARNSATAKIVRGNKDISKEKDVIRRREKGMDMATNVRAKQFRKAVTKKPYGEATTKVAKVSDSDREKLLKLRKMLDKEKNK